VTIGPVATAEAQRILDGAARRLLAARLDGDPVGPAARSNDSAIDNRSDEGAPLVKREQVPITSADSDRRRGGGK
jgi:hypothetical protein